MRLSTVVPTVLIALVLLVPAVFVIIRVLETRERERLKKKRARFEGRPALLLEDIYETYYRDAGFDFASFARFWTELASLLKLDPTRLRPTDRFDQELAAVDGYLAEDELVDVGELYRSRRKRTGRTSRPDLPQTVDELVRICLGEGSARSPDQ